jgi:hypothetical protein
MGSLMFAASTARAIGVLVVCAGVLLLAQAAGLQ